MQRVRRPPLAAVEHVVIAVALDPQLDVARVRAGDVGLGHRERRADLAVEQRRQPALLLLGRAELVEHLHVAGVGRRAVARLGGDRRAPEDLGERRVVAVGEPGAVLVVGQEHVPQPALARQPLQLLHHGRLVMRVAGLAQLALVDLLRRVDVLVHERRQALLEVRTTLAWLEVHRPLLLSRPVYRLRRCIPTLAAHASVRR